MKNRGNAIVTTCVICCLASCAFAEDDPTIDEKPLSTLLKQLRSDNRGFQLRAAQSLAKAPTNLHARIVPMVLPVLKSERENDRFVAAQVLGEYGPVSRVAVPELVLLLKGTQYERNRAAAAKALGQILKDAEPCEEVEKVAEALTAKFDEDFDKYSDVRREAVYALGMIGPAAKKIIPKLGKALKDHPNDLPEFLMVRQAAAWACGRMGPLAAEHMDQLIAMLMSEGGECGIPEYVEAMGRIGPVNDNVVMNIMNRMEIAANHGWLWGNGGPNGNFRAFGSAATKALERFGPKAAPAVPLLTRFLSDKSALPVVLTEVTRTLGAIGPAAKDAIPRLEMMTKYGNSDELHEAAKKALAAIRGEIPKDKK